MQFFLSLEDSNFSRIKFLILVISQVQQITEEHRHFPHHKKRIRAETVQYTVLIPIRRITQSKATNLERFHKIRLHFAVEAVVI